jgi:hypothetical protein
LIAINSSADAWIVDSGASHHMAASKAIYYSLDACKGPPILMGDNSSVEVTGKGRIELTNGSFENVLHVPKLSVNLLSVYQMTNSGTGKKVIFTPNSVDIYNIQTNSRVAIGEVNHQFRLYLFLNSLNPILLYCLLMLMKVVGYGTKGLLKLLRQLRGGGGESVVSVLKQYYAY